MSSTESLQGTLQIYNTLTQQKETFQPLENGKVKMYVCGPTVYNLLHVGNFRGPIFFNMVRNWLERLGYDVTYALNFTDVDDKIIERANKEGVTSEEISEKYIAEYKTDFANLGLRKHDHNPKVTDYMDEIVRIVRDLIERKKAYVAGEGEVLYSVRSFDGYGKLSNRKLDDLQSGARVEVDEKKQDPHDFALWKPAKPGEPKWPSPWSDGRPGWHIECSAMVRGLFGDSIDIHGGGMDLIFPHHENEIAQSEGATGKPYVKYWMHNNMLTFGDRKMSKSIGNIVTAREFLERYNAEILKYMMLGAHYRSTTDFSEKQVHNAISGLARVYSALTLADSIMESESAPATVRDGLQADLTKLNATPFARGERAKVLHETLAAAKLPKAFRQALADADLNLVRALNDDFNTPEALASVYTVVRGFNTVCRHGMKATEESLSAAFALKAWIFEKGSMMSLFQEPPEGFLTRLDDMLLEQMQLKRADIDKLVAERSQAREAKDFARGDELRKQLTEMGIALHDSPTGTHWEVHK